MHRGVGVRLFYPKLEGLFGQATLDAMRDFGNKFAAGKLFTDDLQFMYYLDPDTRILMPQIADIQHIGSYTAPQLPKISDIQHRPNASPNERLTLDDAQRLHKHDVTRINDNVIGITNALNGVDYRRVR